jgi:hypothetical protein
MISHSQEIHLQKALANQADIPTPEVIEIDEQIYDELYPPSSVPKRRVFTLRKFHSLSNNQCFIIKLQF